MKSENLKIYLAEIQNYPLLTEVQEKNLGYLLLKGTERQKHNAKKKLVESNLRLVVHIVNHIKDKDYSSKADLIQQGNLGLMHATEKFDARFGVKFSIYASYWIKAYINSYIAKDFLIRTPIEKNPGNSISLNAHSYDDNPYELFDQIEDENAVNPVLEVEKAELEKICKAAVDTLSLNDRMILTFKYGFDNDGCSRTLEEVSELMIPFFGRKVSKQYIHERCNRATKQMRNNREFENQLKEFL